MKKLVFLTLISWWTVTFVWGQTVRLDAVYATSTAQNSDVRHLFDQNPATVWVAAPGAGLDEGIHIRFAEPTLLAGIEAFGTEGSFADNTGLMDISLDDKTLFQSYIGAKLDLHDAVEGPIREIYLRITHTGWEMDLATETGVFFNPTNRTVGLRSLRFFGKNGQELRLEPPSTMPGTATATNSLAPNYAYGPERLFDGRMELAWAATEADNQIIEFNFEKPVNITALKIWNGYQRSPESYAENQRLRLFEFGIKGEVAEVYTIDDAASPQTIVLKTTLTGKNFQLKIKGRHPGKKYKDVALSELLFYDGGKAFVLSGCPKASLDDLRKKAAQTPIAGLLNRGSRSYSSSLDNDFAQLFTLRDDGTFTLSTLATKFDESETVSVGSGHWEIREAENGQVKVRITGNLRSAFHAFENPAPVTPSNRSFSEILTIDSNTVHGQKVVGAFRFK